jgi:hypothetical protein
LAGALGSFLLAPGGNAINGYYHMILAPPAVLLSATALEWMFERSKLRSMGIAALIVAAIWPLYYVRILYEPRYMPAFHCGEWVRQNTPKNALVLTSSPNPATLYFSDRVGWTSWTEYYGTGARFNKELIEKVRPLGASIAAIDDANFDSAWSGNFNHVRDYLYQNFAAVHGDDFVVFRLDQPAGLLLPPGKRIAFGTNDTRHYLRGAWGPNQDDADHAPCVAMGPALESFILFRSPERPRRVLIELASAAAGQELTISINGAGGNVLAIPEVLKKGTVAIEPDAGVSEANEWTVSLAASRQNKNGASLLLYSLRVE